MPSAAVDDEQTAEWSEAMYDKDLADERKPRTGEVAEIVLGCPDCGSTDPHITIGWPVCVNDEFHEENSAPQRWLRRDFGMRPRVLRRNLGLAFLGAILAGCVLGTGIARADSLDDYVAANGPVVCSLLDSEPTVAGVEGVGMALYSKGLTAEQAGEVLVRSVVGFCPDHLPEVKAFIAKWTRAGTVGA